MLLATLALLAGSMLLGLIAPLVLGRDRIWFRLGRGILLGATALAVFVFSAWGFNRYGQGRTYEGFLHPLYVSASLPYLVPMIYGFVAYRRRARRNGDE
jgi:hypothetical protein